MGRPSRFESGGLNYIRSRYVGDDPERIAAFERAVANAKVAQLIYDMRTRAGLSQADLARRVKTARSVISRLEDADYDGHSLAMLRRVAEALGHRLEISFTPVEDLPVGRARSARRTAAAPTAKAAGGARRKAAK